MYILEQYPKRRVNDEESTAEEFIAQYAWQFDNIFHTEMIAIKNANLEYVAISEAYANEFNLNDNIEIGEATLLFPVNNSLTQYIQDQEQKILEHGEFQDSFLVIKQHDNKNMSHYVLRKRPLINPLTQNIIGLAIVATKYKSGFLREQFVKRFLNWIHKTTPTINTRHVLTDKQRQVLFYLSIGYHSRKEIANILSWKTNEPVKERQVKAALHALYEKFECNSSDQLLKIFFTHKISIDIPLNSVLEGEYLI